MKTNFSIRLAAMLLGASLLTATRARAQTPLSVAQNLLQPTAVQTATYAASPGQLVNIDVSGGSLTFPLPTAPFDGSRVAYKIVNTAGTNTATITCGGSDVLNKTGGSTSLVMSTAFQRADFQYHAGIWSVNESLALPSLDARYAATGDPRFAYPVTQITLSGATVLDATSFGNTYLCTGTAADYTVTLPTPVGNTGKRLSFRMDAGLTRFVTLSCSALIDNVASRVLYSLESVSLYSDGTTWHKNGGFSRPLCASIGGSVLTGQISQTVASGSIVPITLSALLLDSSGRMANVSASTVTVSRAGTYRVDAATPYNGFSGTASRALAEVLDNGTAITTGETYMASGSFGGPTISRVVTLSAGDVLTLAIYQNSGASQSIFVDAATFALLSATEIPNW